jgi:hypothetical protein
MQQLVQAFHHLAHPLRHLLEQIRILILTMVDATAKARLTV